MFKHLNNSKIFNVDMSNIDLSKLVDSLLNKDKTTVAVCNTNTLVTADKNPQFLKILNSFTYRVPDGMPLVWIMKTRGLNQERLNGMKILLNTIEKGLNTKTKHYFLGSSFEVLEKLKKELKTQYPEVLIEGTLSPPFGSEEEIIKFIDKNKNKFMNTDILWIGLGMPKQEVIMNHLKQMNLKIAGIGAVFEWVAGTKSVAPSIMQNLGLEWLYRLFKEPRRLWKRYFFDFSYIVKKNILNLLKIK
tara:strand:- start:664 stop:1401 length:738 start_codon:yes stop_codon:yes gene_type:complete